MRISPKSLSPTEAIAKAKANAASKEVERRQAAERDAAAEAAEAAAPRTSPAEIDANRAQQLLKRAASLAERGDSGAAVLATRQSLALAPTNVDGHLQLAGLLEQARDFGGARAAYEKSVQLAPDRAEARDNLNRINVYLEKSQNAAGQFQFDAEELFPTDKPATPAVPAAETKSEAKTEPGESALENAAPVLAMPMTAPIASDSTDAKSPAATQAKAPLDLDSMDMFDESMLPSIEARLPPSRQEGAEAENKGAVAPAQSAFMAQAEAAEVEAKTAPAQAAPAQTEAPIEKPVGDRRKNNVPVATERRRRPAQVVAPVPAAMAPAAPRPVNTPTIAPVASPAVASPAVASPAVASPAVASPAVAPVPLQPRRASDAIFDNSTSSTPVASRAPSRAPVAPLNLNVPAAPTAPLWQQVAARPSFYARTLPLVGVALLGLGFLSWARGRAVSQVVAPVPTEMAQANPGLAPDSSLPSGPETVPGTTLPVAGSGAPTLPANNAGGFPISNAPAVFQAPPASTNANSTGSAPSTPATNPAPTGNRAPARTNAAAPARANNRGTNGTSSSRPRQPRRVLPPARPVPNFPSVSLAPAPIPPASVRSTIPRTTTNRADNGSNIVLPSPTIDFPSAPAPRSRVLPPSDNGLNPAGSPNRGYVRVTEGRVGNGVIPSQPSAVARDNERQANDSAREGQTDQAISQLSQAIRADSDNAGFRYQQRATLFLQRGDYNRATDDFQSAISAYQAQIGRGDDVAQARRGLASARSGLNLALAGKRR